MNRELVHEVRRNGYRTTDDSVFIQSFEVTNLRELDTMTNLRLVQLLWLDGKPYVEAGGGTLTYDDMATPSGLAEIATHADDVGPGEVPLRHASRRGRRAPRQERDELRRRRTRGGVARAPIHVPR